MASQSADQGTVMGVLQCLFYPILVPLLKNTVRSQKGIDVRCTEFNKA